MKRFQERMPKLNDQQPQDPIRVREPYRMTYNLSEEIKSLNERIGSEYITFPYCIASSNVFVNREPVCVPAEIGMAKYSLRHGIRGTFHAFIDPGADIPIWEVPNVVDFSKHHHMIPHEGFSFPDLRKVIPKVHEFIHTVEFNGQKEAIIFVEFDEVEQMSEVFNWFETKSQKLGLPLQWKVTFISLRTLFAFLNSRLSLTSMDASDAFIAFKTCRYNYTDLCSFHDLNECRHCAISKAFIYSYVLSDNFASSFGVKKLKRIEGKNGSFKYDESLL